MKQQINRLLLPIAYCLCGSLLQFQIPLNPSALTPSSCAVSIAYCLEVPLKPSALTPSSCAVSIVIGALPQTPPPFLS